MPRSLTYFFVAVVFGCNFAAYGQAARHARAVLREHVNERRLVTLYGNTRPEANAANDRGPVADDFPMDHLFLQLKRSPDQQKALEQFMDELHDPNSPNFHQWLTAQQFGDQFGLAKEDLDTVTTWLQSHGFTVNAVSANLVVDFSGTAGQIREAFHTRIHHLSVNGQPHFANMSNPQIPAALYPAIIGIVSLHNFKPHSLSHAVPSYTISSGAQAVVPADLAKIYDLATAFAAGYSGQGQTIALLEDSNVYSTGDWLVFRKVFGLARNYPQGNLITVHPQAAGGSTCRDPGLSGDETEAILDAEWASAAAPNATIEIASCATGLSVFGGLIALQNLLNDNTNPPPAIASISFGNSEAFLGEANNAFISSLYQLAVAEGVSIFVASGDQGAASSDTKGGSAATHGLAVNGFASTPYNVAVGGTDFADTYFGTVNNYWSPTNSPVFGSAVSYIPEIPWNSSCASELLATSNGFSITYGFTGYCNRGGTRTTLAGGGGPSACATGMPGPSGVVGNTCAGYAKPSWQSIFGNPNDGVRDVPDVSLFAANGSWGHYYVACFSDSSQGGRSCLGTPSTWSGFGGTSIASPIMAGIQTLVNQATQSRWGNPNPVYYQLAAAQYGSGGNSACNSSDGSSGNNACTFNDVTLGDINVDCTGSNSCFSGSIPGIYGVLSTSNLSYDPAYRAAIGWDFATGIGSVQAWSLLTNWPGTLAGASSGPAFSTEYVK